MSNVIDSLGAYVTRNGSLAYITGTNCYGNFTGVVDGRAFVWDAAGQVAGAGRYTIVRKLGSGS